ncbi:MAG: hypothetical protein VB018_13360 [Lachnospiraceae bacterium]|nr:hypothetical protein [Lachnospiraceae bacterium]
MDISKISILISIIGVLVVVVNIITEVVKSATYNKIPTQFLAIGISMVLTLVAFFAYCQYMSITVVWYYICGAVIVGIMVAYAAIFGFDTLKAALGKAITNTEDTTDTEE